MSKVSRKDPLAPKGITCPEGIWSNEASILFHEKKLGAEASDKKMGDIAQGFIHFLLITPELEVFTINSYDGGKQPIDRDYLRTRTAITDIIRGFIPFSDTFHTSDTDGEFIFVNKTQFEKFLADKPIIGCVVPEETESPSLAYTPVYLALMLKAVKDLNLSPTKRTNKDEVISWLTQNWPSDLEGKSDRIIETMATLLRRPEDKKGGNTSWK